MHEGWQRLPTARRRRGLVRSHCSRACGFAFLMSFLALSRSPPVSRSAWLASSFDRPGNSARRTLRGRFRLGHGRSGLLLRRQKRLARWASHAGPAMMYTSSVLRLLMEGRARRVLGCPSRRGDSIRQSMQLRNCASLCACGRCGAHARRRRGRPRRGVKGGVDLLRKKKLYPSSPLRPTAYHTIGARHPNKTRASAAPPARPT